MTGPHASALRRGIDHFNRGEYFEAHEAWETLWLDEPGPLADFYKGLIQCAAALHHLRRGNLAGARRLYDRQRRYLSRYVPDTLGVPTAQLLASMDALFAPLLVAPVERPVAVDPATMPTIVLGPPPD